MEVKYFAENGIGSGHTFSDDPDGFPDFAHVFCHLLRTACRFGKRLSAHRYARLPVRFAARADFAGQGWVGEEGGVLRRQGGISGFVPCDLLFPGGFGHNRPSRSRLKRCT